MSVTELSVHQAPRDDRTRWIPHRAGILNIWRYYDEIFEFHRGRLLLRGPNGTGKSKALEVLLPFLFDANLRPNRLSTFGTADRTMHWNLMGEGATGVTRVGYVWLELSDGERWFTCGARLQASQRTSGTSADFFTTGHRIGTELSLVTEGGRPLTRAALVEALGPNGTVYDSAGDYRSALRAHLFAGISEQQYDALITALLQLRTPKLSQRLDPGLLSTLLSKALPPLDQGDIAELAEGFERLDRQREDLARLDELVRVAESVALRARTYSRRVLRATAAQLISATSTMDTRTRTARESQEKYEQVVASRQEAQATHQGLTTTGARLRDRIEGLTASDSYREGRQLDQLRLQATEADQRATRLAGTAGRARGDSDSLDRDAAEATRVSMRALATVEGQRTRLATDAERLALGAVVPPAGLDIDAAAAKRLVTSGVTERLAQIDDVRRAITQHAAAVEARTRQEQEQEAAVAHLHTANEALHEAKSLLALALDQMGERLVAWALGCTELRVDPDRLAAAVDSAQLVADLVIAARQVVLDRLNQQRADLAHQAARLREEQDRVHLELNRSRARLDQPPPAPPSRTASREGRAGAPFWKLITFFDGVPAATQAGVEAALEASGLLDAWVAPDGLVRGLEGHDVFAVTSAESPGSDTAGTLAQVVIPESDGAVPAEVVLRLLCSIGFGAELPGSGTVAVGADGRWRLAALSGSWAKTESAHIGAVARERARRRRISELEEALARIEAALGDLGQTLKDLAEQQERVDAEARARPDHREVDAAGQRQMQAQAVAGSAQQRVDDSRTRLQEGEHAAALALRALTTLAAQKRLPAEERALDRLASGLRDLSSSADAWSFAHVSALQSREVAQVRQERADDAGRTAAEAQEEALGAAETAAGLQARLAGVEQAIGATYQQVLTDIQAARIDLGQVQIEATTVAARLGELREQQGSLSTARERDASERDEAVAARNEAADRVRALTSGHLVADAGIELGDRDGVKGALEAARTIAATWQTVPFEPRNISDAQNRLIETLHASRDVLAHRGDLEMVTEDDVQVLSASLGGMRISASALLEQLKLDLSSSRDDITGAEHALFDRTLTGDTRRQLAARIRQAGDLVDAMNARLALVRTASSVAVRLTWQVDPQLPPGTRAARELLLKDPVRLSDDDRQALHAFFRERIEEARSANTAASWEQQLAEVFDYTAWHHFQVTIDRGKGAEKLTSRLHGALSGGEKAIALHLPLFAAIAAHYQAAPAGPRIILLDEVFVGVDAANRGQVFTLLAALDLDLMLTSDHEWCTYRELNGIAIHQLMTGTDEDDAVTSVRFTWDGHELLTEQL